ncbi:MAG: glycoside hydrolase family 3 protein [Alphaproteobacteria bacterium]|nr:glycoside hydrolase family 3 protein [Alphaproteobacteria bacterium]
MSKPILSAMLSCKGAFLTDEEKRLFAKYCPLGVTLFERNIRTKKELKILVDDIKNAINRDDVLIAIDGEGGRVSRLKKIKRTPYVSAESLSKYPIEYSKIHAELMSVDMREFGINVNYAPVIDIAPDVDNNVLSSRCFGKNKNDIVKYATAMADAYIAMSVCPCIKHIPGHFSCLKDPHLNILDTNLSVKEIEKEVEYLNFVKDYPLSMTSHITLNSIDDKNPVSSSEKSISTLIRGIIGFDGFLLSDAIDMHAVRGNIVEKAINCLDAGIDAICYCAGNIDELNAICNEKRFMTEKSLIRFANIKKVIHNTPKRIDIKLKKNFYVEGLKDVMNVKYTYDATEVLHKMLKKGEVK